MTLYIYNDYLVLYVPGMLDMMSAGSMGPLGEATTLTMLLVALIMAIPASMIFLSSTIPARVSRLLNLVIGPIYLVIAGLTLIGSAPFYQLIVAVEIVALLLVIFIALRWPRQSG